MHEIILEDEIKSHCLWCRYIKMVVCIGLKILHGSLLHGSFCMGRRLRNKKSECVVNLSGSKQKEKKIQMCISVLIPCRLISAFV